MGRFMVLISALCCVIALFTLPGCMGFGGSKQIKNERIAGDVAGPDKLDQWDTYKWPGFNGPKKRIAVGEVVNATAHAQGNAMALAARSEMENVLFASNRYTLLERKEENLKGALNEQDMAAAGMTVATSAPQAGKLLGAAYAIDASVTQLQDNAGGGTIGGIGANEDGFGGFAIGGKRCEATVQVKIRDNQTGQIIATFNGKGYDAKASFGLATVGVNPNSISAGGLGSYANTSIGRALRRAVNEAVLKIVNTLGKEPWKGVIVEILESGQLAIKGGKDMNLVPGMRMKVLHKVKEMIDPETQESLGFDTQEIATVVIDRVMDRASYVKLESGSLESVAVGDFLNMIEAAPAPAAGGASRL